MKKAKLIWLIVGISLVLRGALVAGGALMMLKWDFSSLGTVKYETNTHEITDEFSSISVKAFTGDIKILPSDDGSCKVVCHEQRKLNHTVQIKDGTLFIEEVDSRKWYETVGIMISSENTTVTVYLPKSEYVSMYVKLSTGDVCVSKDFNFESIEIQSTTGDILCEASANSSIKLSASTGHITIKDVSATQISMSVTTGDLTASGINCAEDFTAVSTSGDKIFTDVVCKNLTASSDTGDFTLNNVIASEKFDIKATTGDVTLERCDAAEINIKTTTGDVSGTLLSDKSFFTQTDTGDVSVPRTTGGACNVNTDTGDIEFSILTQ
jgi:DUF4097 and DUF4098 domain-containing protein YvlB